MKLQDFLQSKPYNEAIESERDPTDRFNYYGEGGGGAGGKMPTRGLGSVGAARSSHVGIRWRQDPVTGTPMRYPMGSGIGGRSELARYSLSVNRSIFRSLYPSPPHTFPSPARHPSHLPHTVSWGDLTLEQIRGKPRTIEQKRRRGFLGPVINNGYAGPIMVSRYVLEALGLTVFLPVRAGYEAVAWVIRTVQTGTDESQKWANIEACELDGSCSAEEVLPPRE